MDFRTYSRYIHTAIEVVLIVLVDDHLCGKSHSVLARRVAVPEELARVAKTISANLLRSVEKGSAREQAQEPDRIRGQLRTWAGDSKAKESPRSRMWAG
jgi:hypothetical protein